MEKVFRKKVTRFGFAMIALAIGALPIITATSLKAQPVTLPNLGGDMGGHTPRGFRGQGSGVFVGDNLNPRFPNGEGVQAFISFDLTSVAGWQIESAQLFTAFLRIRGEPFADLGEIRLEQVSFARFSNQIWDGPAISSFGCVLDISPDQTSAGCDLTEAVQNTLGEGSDILQFRLRFEKVSDEDGQQDLALFFKRDSNTNEGGVFDLTLR